MLKKSNEHIAISPVVRTFEIFAAILLFLSLFCIAAYLVTQPKELSKLCNKYVRSVELDHKYFENYEAVGFTEAQVEEMLTDDLIYNLLAIVMTERAQALFDDEFTEFTSEEYCEQTIRDLMDKYLNKYHIQITDKKKDSLVKYTLDVSGIEAMYFYKTPIAYKESVVSVDADNQDLIVNNNILKTLTLLCKWYTFTTLLFMYIIIVIILFVISDSNDIRQIHKIVSDSTVYPSLMVLGISLGAVLGLPEQQIFTTYLLRWLVVVGLAGTLIGSAIYIAIWIVRMKQKTNKS